MEERENYAEVESSGKSSFLGRVEDAYFKTRKFEEGGRLYEALGVNAFRKYCPTGGSRWVKGDSKSSYLKSKGKVNLEGFVNRTKLIEGVHLLWGAGLGAWSAFEANQGDYISAGAYTALNVITNFYPIIAQRYNRNKVNNLIKRKKARKLA